jgi:FMN reductase
MSFLVISCSLNPSSRSRGLATRAAEALREHGAEADLVDLQDVRLPHCDGAACYEVDEVLTLSDRIAAAEGVLLATPIYNYSASASVVNLIELTGQAWNDKVVGFLCAAGGAHSYMSVMGLANSLMLDFRSIVIPRFVYSDESAYDGSELVDPAIEKRLDELAATLIRIGRALGNGVQSS